MSEGQTPWRLKRTRQCKKCPWKVSVDPYTIPRGYDRASHLALASTIADPADPSLFLHVMACHDTHDAHCIGWLVNQAGPGNNIGLRIKLLTCTNAQSVRTVGRQHENFWATIPSDKARAEE